MVEEADVVVLLLERLDLALDEVVELGEVGSRAREAARDPWVLRFGSAEDGRTLLQEGADGLVVLRGGVGDLEGGQLAPLHLGQVGLVGVAR